MATYQGTPWVIKQIESILAQRGVELCLDVADDRSADGTYELVTSAFKSDSRVRALQWATASGSAGGNFRRLIDRAQVDGFDFVAFADQDDIWYDEKLLRAVETMSAANAQAYSSAVDVIDADGRRGQLTQCAKGRPADFLFEGAGQGCTFVMRQDFFRSVQNLVRRNHVLASAMHYHDWLVYVVARASARNQWYFDPVSTMSYRQHHGNELGARGGLSSITRRLDQIRNGWFRRQVGAAFELYVAAGGSDMRVTQFGRLFTSPPSLLRRLRMTLFVVKHGRRRLIDRAVLGVSALAGWL